MFGLGRKGVFFVCLFGVSFILYGIVRLRVGDFVLNGRYIGMLRIRVSIRG